MSCQRAGASLRLAAQLGPRCRRPGDDVVIGEDVDLPRPRVGDVADHVELRVVDRPIGVLVRAGAKLDHRVDDLAEGGERLGGSRRQGVDCFLGAHRGVLEHHVGAVVEHEADEAEHVGRAVGFLLVGVGRQRLRQQPLGHRLVVVNAEQLPLYLLQRRRVGPLDVALEQAVLRHQDAAEAFRVDHLLVELPHCRWCRRSRDTRRRRCRCRASRRPRAAGSGWSCG